MRRRNHAIAFAIMALIASTLLVAPAASADHHLIRCDHDYVKVHGTTIKVLPTGVDDTENLQCALDLATSMRWAKVKLIAGEYHTSFLEAEGFHGVFKGAGRDHTTILTLAEGLDCITRLEQAGDLFLLTFGGSNVVVKDLTIGVGGDAPCTEPWDSFVDEEGFGYQDRSIGAIYRHAQDRAVETCPAEIVDFHSRLRHRRSEPASGLVEPVVEWNNFFTGVAAGAMLPILDEESWLRGL